MLSEPVCRRQSTCYFLVILLPPCQDFPLERRLCSGQNIGRSRRNTWQFAQVRIGLMLVFTIGELNQELFVCATIKWDKIACPLKKAMVLIKVSMCGGSTKHSFTSYLFYHHPTHNILEVPPLKPSERPRHQPWRGEGRPLPLRVPSALSPLVRQWQSRPPKSRR